MIDTTHLIPKKAISYGNKYEPLSRIVTQEDADAYFEALVQHCMSFGKLRAEAEEIERQNIGYWTGYLDRTTGDRLLELFRTTHPIFGNTPVSCEEAFELGKRWAAGESIEKLRNSRGFAE